MGLVKSNRSISVVTLLVLLEVQGNFLLSDLESGRAPRGKTQEWYFQWLDPPSNFIAHGTHWASSPSSTTVKNGSTNTAPVADFASERLLPVSCDSLFLPVFPIFRGGSSLP